MKFDPTPAVQTNIQHELSLGERFPVTSGYFKDSKNRFLLLFDKIEVSRFILSSQKKNEFKISTTELFSKSVF